MKMAFTFDVAEAQSGDDLIIILSATVDGAERAVEVLHPGMPFTLEELVDALLALKLEALS